MNKETKRDRERQFLELLCQRMDGIIEKPSGTISGRLRTQDVSFWRDLVIRHAFDSRIPVARIAVFFGKTRHGIMASLKRTANAAAYEDTMQKLKLWETYEPQPDIYEMSEDELTELYSEGRIYKTRQNYED